MSYNIEDSGWKEQIFRENKSSKHFMHKFMKAKGIGSKMPKDLSYIERCMSFKDLMNKQRYEIENKTIDFSVKYKQGLNYYQTANADPNSLIPREFRAMYRDTANIPKSPNEFILKPNQTMIIDKKFLKTSKSTTGLKLKTTDNSKSLKIVINNDTSKPNRNFGNKMTSSLPLFDQTRDKTSIDGIEDSNKISKPNSKESTKIRSKSAHKLNRDSSNMKNLNSKPHVKRALEILKHDKDQNDQLKAPIKLPQVLFLMLNSENIEYSFLSPS